MRSPRIISVNTGTITDIEVSGRPNQTAIDKRRVAGRVFAGKLGLAGDEQADKDHHGGPEREQHEHQPQTREHAAAAEHPVKDAQPGRHPARDPLRGEGDDHERGERDVDDRQIVGGL